MMKRFLIALSVLVLAGAPLASGWSRLGHAVVAKVAEDHLSSKARKALAAYLGDETIVSISSDADLQRPFWTMDLGFIPTNPEAARLSWLVPQGFDTNTPENISPISHSVTVDRNFNSLRTDNQNGAYVNNAAYYIEQYARELKEGARTMDPELRKRKIALIVHLIGDFHCPMHIVYQGQDELKGSFTVTIGKSQVRYHGWWDGGIFANLLPYSYSDVARIVDTKSKKEIAQITKGDVYDWVHESAVDSWPAHRVKEGDVLDQAFPLEMRPILYNQLRNGGYRLAALLNDIFR